MDRFWLKSYPPEVPLQVDTEQFRSLNQLFEDSFRKNGTRPFSVCMDRWMRYNELDELSAALGAWLQQLLGHSQAHAARGAGQNRQGLGHGRSPKGLDGLPLWQVGK